MDKFYEQFITKDYGTLPRLFNMLSKGSLLFGLGFVLSFTILSIPCFITFIVLEVLISKSFLEYEYEYYDDEMRIDKIIGKRKRKTIVSFPLSNIVKVLKPNAQNEGVSIKKCTIQGVNLKEMIIVVNTDKGNIGYLIGVDEKMYGILKRSNYSLFGYI